MAMAVAVAVAVAVVAKRERERKRLVRTLSPLIMPHLFFSFVPRMKVNETTSSSFRASLLANCTSTPKSALLPGGGGSQAVLPRLPPPQPRGSASRRHGVMVMHYEVGTRAPGEKSSKLPLSTVYCLLFTVHCSLSTT
jgi:hypothetical protein